MNIARSEVKPVKYVVVPHREGWAVRLVSTGRLVKTFRNWYAAFEFSQKE